MIKILIIGTGGFVGAVLRYWASGWVETLWGHSGLPLGTLAVNIVGCFLMGLFSFLAETRLVITPELRHLILVGFLGAFTTYSTFGNETFSMIRDSEFGFALISVVAHLLGGLAAVFGGRMVATILWR